MHICINGVDWFFDKYSEFSKAVSIILISGSEQAHSQVLGFLGAKCRFSGERF